MNCVGRSVVSAITLTPASGPFALVTTPPMSSTSTATVVDARCAPIFTVTTSRTTIKATIGRATLSVNRSGIRLTTAPPLRFRQLDLQQAKKYTSQRSVYFRLDRPRTQGWAGRARQYELSP